jgi:hypothetical protein
MHLNPLGKHAERAAAGNRVTLKVILSKKPLKRRIPTDLMNDSTSLIAPHKFSNVEINIPAPDAISTT